MRSFISKAVSGAAAGLVATGVMSVAMWGAKRAGLLGEPPPRRLVRRLLAPLGPWAPRGAALDVTATLAHFGFGASMGTLFGLLPERAQTLLGGAAYGLGVWAVNYAGWIPQAGLMPPARRDRPGRPTAMIAAHLIFGAALAAAQREMPRVAEAFAPGGLRLPRAIRSGRSAAAPGHSSLDEVLPG